MLEDKILKYLSGIDDITIEQCQIKHSQVIVYFQTKNKHYVIRVPYQKVLNDDRRKKIESLLS